MRIAFFVLIGLILCEINSRLKGVSFISRDDKEDIAIVNAFCFANINGIVFDIGNLYDSTSDYSLKNGETFFSFNFCKFGHSQCKKSHSYITSKQNNSADDCKLLSSPNNQTTPEWRIKDKNASSSIEIILPKGEACNEGETSGYYSTRYIINCDHSIPNVLIENTKNVSNAHCTNTIELRSQYACPDYRRYSLFTSMKKNSLIIGLIILFIGVYYSFFSCRFLRQTRILTGAALIILAAFSIASSSFNMLFSTLSLYLLFCLSAFVGLLVGYILSRYPYVMSSLLGGLLGYVLTGIFFHSFALLITHNPRNAYYIMLICFVSVGMIMGLVFQRQVFVFGSSFGGAYCIMKGFGLLQNMFPMENQLYDLIEREEWSQLHTLLDYSFYLYMMFTVFLGICGVVFQYRRYFKDIRESEREFN